MEGSALQHVVGAILTRSIRSGCDRPRAEQHQQFNAAASLYSSVSEHGYSSKILGRQRGNPQVPEPGVAIGKQLDSLRLECNAIVLCVSLGTDSIRSRQGTIVARHALHAALLSGGCTEDLRPWLGTVCRKRMEQFRSCHQYTSLLRTYCRFFSRAAAVEERRQRLPQSPPPA